MQKNTLALFFLGFTFGSGPCLASCGPILLSYVAATKRSMAASLKTYFLFSLSRIAVYLAIGLLVFFAGEVFSRGLLESSSRYIYAFGGLFIIILAFVTAFKDMELNFCAFLKKYSLEKNRKSVIFLGLIIGLLPCAPLLAVFSYVALEAGDISTALVYLLSFGLGTLISPLAILVIFSSFIPNFILKKNLVAAKIFNFVCAGILCFFGIKLIRGAF